MENGDNDGTDGWDGLEKNKTVDAAMNNARHPLN